LMYLGSVIHFIELLLANLQRNLIGKKLIFQTNKKKVAFATFFRWRKINVL